MPNARPSRATCQRRAVEPLEAGDGARTRDPQLGKLMLYQLSYSRKEPPVGLEPTTARLRIECSTTELRWRRHDGAEGTRTPGLLGAIQALSQLSYSPDSLRSGSEFRVCGFRVPCPTPERATRQPETMQWAREDSNL